MQFPGRLHLNTSAQDRVSGWYYPARGDSLLLVDNLQGTSIREVNAHTGKQVGKLDHYRDSDSGVKFLQREFAAQNSEVLVFSSLPGTLHLFNRASFKALAHFDSEMSVEKISSARSCPWLVTMGQNGQCKSFDFHGQLRWDQKPLFTDQAKGISVSSDDRVVVLDHGNRKTTLLDAETGRLIEQIDACGQMELGHRFATGISNTQSLVCMKASDRSQLWAAGGAPGIRYTGCALMEADNLVVAWDSLGTLYYHFLATGELLLTDGRFPIPLSLAERHVFFSGPERETFIFNHTVGEESYWVSRFGSEAPAWCKH